MSKANTCSRRAGKVQGPKITIPVRGERDIKVEEVHRTPLSTGGYKVFYRIHIDGVAYGPVRHSPCEFDDVRVWLSQLGVAE